MHVITSAIGDIHGRLDLMQRALDLIEADAAREQAAAKIVFTGDFMDRGAHSCGVVERLLAGPRRPCDLFARAATHGRDVPDWAWQLFFHTLASYGLDREGDWRADPRLRRHAAYLSGLPLTHDDGRYLFVHAGIRPGVPMQEQTEWDLLWIRDEFLNHEGPLHRRVVHGHTIMGDKPETRSHRVSIDTGAYRSGILTVAALDGPAVRFLQAVGEPDRGAMVRELLLVEEIGGRTITPALRRSLDRFLAGAIDAGELAAQMAQVT